MSVVLLMEAPSSLDLHSFYLNLYENVKIQGNEKRGRAEPPSELLLFIAVALVAISNTGEGSSPRDVTGGAGSLALLGGLVHCRGVVQRGLCRLGPKLVVTHLAIPFGVFNVLGVVVNHILHFGFKDQFLRSRVSRDGHEDESRKNHHKKRKKLAHPSS
jgi:hypothetical protein